MFTTLGFDETIKNVYRISAPTAPVGAVRTVDDLRIAFHNFLEKYHPKLPVNRSEDLFVADQSREDAVVNAYAGDNVLNDLKQDAVIGDAYSMDEKTERIAVARDALDQFLACDENLAQVFRLAIHSIIIRPSRRDSVRSARGGSSSGAIGTIWLSLDVGISKYDVMEMLLHELTHNLMYIDELNFPHYNYGKVLDKRTQALSAILKMSRPMDKVIHSIVVASEILLGRQRFLPKGYISTVHPADDQLRLQSEKSLESIYAMQNVDDIILPRVHFILSRCIQRCSYNVDKGTSRFAPSDAATVHA